MAIGYKIIQSPVRENVKSNIMYTRISFNKKPSKGPSSISFLSQVQILVLKVS